MPRLNFYEEHSPDEVLPGQEVCFARHVTIRDQVALHIDLSDYTSPLGTPILMTVYGLVHNVEQVEVTGGAKKSYVVSLDIWTLHLLHPGGITSEFSWGEQEGDSVERDFQFLEGETLTRVSHSESTLQE